MKYMILLYGSQQDCDALTGKQVPGKPAWGAEDFAAMGAFMAEFAKGLAESGELVETRGLTAPFLCCHPALSPASQIALTLRAVGGLTTSEIGRAFLVPEATMTRRISRAKQSIKASGMPFSLPAASERAARLGAVLHVLYLIFNEGYASTAGPDLHRSELSAEAIRLVRIVHRLLPEDAEVTGLLALMHLR